jgi:Tol biopolymer transport system component
MDLGARRARRRSSGVLIAVMAIVSATTHAVGATTDDLTEPVDGVAGHHPPVNAFSFRPWMSGDGRLVAFDSNAVLAPGAAHGVRNVYVYERSTGAISLVSVGLNGVPSNGDSQRATVSTDGRFVAFWSAADNLVDGDTNGVTDAFVRDRQTNTTTRVSVGPDGRQANGASARPVISGDGNLVAFESAASNLLPDNVLGKKGDTNGVRDVYVYNRSAQTTVRVSVGSDGKEGRGESVRPSISADGHYVAFQSLAAFDPADTNGKTDVYVHDMSSGTTQLVSVSPGGAVGDQGSFSPSVSADGRYIAYWSNAHNLVADDTNGVADVFVADRTTGRTERVSVGTDGAESDGASSDPSISRDGRYVSFWSAATNLVPGDTNGKRDVFVVDREKGTTQRVSVASDGTQGNGDSYSPCVAVIDDGRVAVAFDSASTNFGGNRPSPKGKHSAVFLHLDDQPPSPGK